MNNTVRTSIPVAPGRERATPELNGRLSSMDCLPGAANCLPGAAVGTACLVSSMPIAAGVLHYIAAPCMAVVTQQVGAGVLNACGGAVPPVGAELARNGAMGLRHVTALFVAGQCCYTVTRDISGSNGSSGGSSCCAQTVFAAANPAWGIMINHADQLTTEEIVKILVASMVGSVPVNCAINAAATASILAAGAACMGMAIGQYQAIESGQPLNEANQQPPAQQAPHQVEMTPHAQEESAQQPPAQQAPVQQAPNQVQMTP